MCNISKNNSVYDDTDINNNNNNDIGIQNKKNILDMNENNNDIYVNEHDMFFDVNDLIEIKTDAYALEKEEHIDIFKLIKRDGVKYTENKNGIFVIMKNLKKDTIIDIKKFIDYIKTNKIHFENDTIQRESLKEQITNEMNNPNVHVASQSNKKNIDNTSMSISCDGNNHNDDDITSGYTDMFGNNSNVIYDPDSIVFNYQDVPQLKDIELDLCGLNNTRLDKTKLYEKKR